MLLDTVHMDSQESNITEASVQFLKWQDLYLYEKPFNIFMTIPSDAEDQRTTNLVFEEKSINITDVRGRESMFDLDSHGFMYRRLLEVPDCNSSAAIEGIYIPKVKRMLQSEVGEAEEIIVFDWRVGSR